MNSSNLSKITFSDTNQDNHDEYDRFSDWTGSRRCDRRSNNRGNKKCDRKTDRRSNRRSEKPSDWKDNRRLQRIRDSTSTRARISERRSNMRCYSFDSIDCISVNEGLWSRNNCGDYFIPDDDDDDEDEDDFDYYVYNGGCSGISRHGDTVYIGYDVRIGIYDNGPKIIERGGIIAIEYPGYGAPFVIEQLYGGCSKVAFRLADTDLYLTQGLFGEKARKGVTSLLSRVSGLLPELVPNISEYVVANATTADDRKDASVNYPAMTAQPGPPGIL